MVKELFVSVCGPIGGNVSEVGKASDFRVCCCVAGVIASN